MTQDRTDDELAGPRQQLYAAEPEAFVTVRTELAAAARQGGDTALAKRIAALRKPTTSASIVNRHVLSDPSVQQQLTRIGDRLRTAQNGPGGIDREVLRELSTERRALVHDVSEAALDAFGPSSGPAIRDEVVSTFDAAVADPGVAAQLGGLVRAQQWSGFGVVGDAPAAPKAAKPAAAPGKKRPPVKQKRSAADERRSAAEQKLSGAERDLSAAEADLSTALDEQQAASDRLGELRARLADLQTQVSAAEKLATVARESVRVARTRQRAARSARDRAARGAVR